MAYGFEVLNNNAQVLISNQSRTLHFVGKAAYIGLSDSRSRCGGMRLFTYRIPCPYTPVPFFTMPTTDFYAVVGVRQEAAGSWIIEVLRSGVSNSVPEVYVFTDPRGITYSGNETHGLQVFCDDGTLSFDSRLSPLVVTGGEAVVPPSSPVNPAWFIHCLYETVHNFPAYHWWRSEESYLLWKNYKPSYDDDDYAEWQANQAMTFWKPRDSGNQYALWGDKASADPTPFLKPTQYSEVITSVGEGNYKPIYFYPSFAQATRVVAGAYYKSGTYWCTSNYWSLYRGSIANVGGVLKCGWVSYVQGSYWKALRKDSGVSVGTGVDSSSIVSAGSGGTPPYYNETLNLTPTAVIIANGSRYD